ncbi:MAG: GntR family transcriptional regulator [Phycisphaeraceae bacterium JB051]
MPSMPQTRSNLAMQAYEHIHCKLWNGELAVGSKLPEVALAKEIGVSRTPVREAVAQLESEGFLVQIPNTGSFVRMIQRDELDELFDFRMHLECYALELVIQSADAELIQKLSHLSNQMFALIRKQYDASQADDITEGFVFTPGWHQLDAQFHELLLQSANNRWIKRVSGQLHLMSRIFMPGRIVAQNENSWHRAIRVWRQHRRIARSIQTGNFETGRDTLRLHIDQGRHESMAFMDWIEDHINDKPSQRRKLPEEQANMLENILHLREVLANQEDA